MVKASKRRRQLSVTVEKLLDSIDAAALRHVPIDPTRPEGAKHARLRSLLARSREVMLIERANESGQPDGYASTTPGNGSPGGGKGGGPTIAVEIPDDEPARLPQSEEGREWLASLHETPERVELVPTTSTERAALARGADRPDPLRNIARDLDTQWRTVETAFMRISALCDRWDRLRSTVALVNVPQCHVAEVLYKLPFDDKWKPHRSTTFEGLIDWPEARPVCRMVYDFTRDNARLPSKAEMVQYLERTAIRVQTGPGTSP